MPLGIAENLRDVRRRIAAAAGRVGRDAAGITLVAVTKRRGVEEIRELIDAGHCVFGENRVPEALEKQGVFRESGPTDIEWHLIGHLQSNKAKKAVGRFALIHGVDSVHLAEALQRAAEAADTTVSILLQVNVSGEATKSGFASADLRSAVVGLAPLDRVRCVGLMTMAPFVDDTEETRPVFRGLREARDRLRDAGFGHVEMTHLSMGMSNDFEVAVEEGATLVRVGTALFQ